MVKGKQQQPNPPAGSKENEDGGDELAGSTLEDYFATHKVSGLVSQHLLNISTENDVMAVQNVDAEDEDSRNDSDRMLAKESEARNDQRSEIGDYEAETSSSKAEPPSELAGMSLSDYLHVTEDSTTEAQEKVSRARSLRVLPPQLAARKHAPISDVSGMSLDHYLGAAAQVNCDDKSEDKILAARADTKPSPKVKRKGGKLKQNSTALPQAKATQHPFSVRGSGLIHGPHATNTSSQNVSSDEESGSASSPSSSLTPFQRRQRRKEKVKLKQQRTTGGGGSSVSKAILMTEVDSSPSTILSVRDRERRKRSLTVVSASTHTHHPVHHVSHPSSSNFQPPLPKLGVSHSVRSLGPKDHDVEGNDDDTAEKLPPL